MISVAVREHWRKTMGDALCYILLRGLRPFFFGRGFAGPGTQQPKPADDIAGKICGSLSRAGRSLGARRPATRCRFVCGRSAGCGPDLQIQRDRGCAREARIRRNRPLKRPIPSPQACWQKPFRNLPLLAHDKTRSLPSPASTKKPRGTKAARSYAVAAGMPRVRAAARTWPARCSSGVWS